MASEGALSPIPRVSSGVCVHCILYTIGLSYTVGLQPLYYWTAARTAPLCVMGPTMLRQWSFSFSVLTREEFSAFPAAAGQCQVTVLVAACWSDVGWSSQRSGARRFHSLSGAMVVMLGGELGGEQWMKRELQYPSMEASVCTAEPGRLE